MCHREKRADIFKIVPTPEGQESGVDEKRRV